MSRLLRIPYLAQLNLRRWMMGCHYRLRTAWRGSAPASVEPRIQDPGKILLIVSGLIGDSVMCAPVIEEARRIWPNAGITLMGRQHNCELFSDSPFIDDLYQAPALPFSLRGRREQSCLREWAAAKSFDIAIILLGDDFAGLLASVNIPIRVGSRGTLLESCLTHPFDCATPRSWGPPEKLNALRALGFEVHNPLPRLSVSDETRNSARNKLRALGLPAGTPFAVIHPFGSEPGKWWPIDRVDELSCVLADRAGLPCILIGSPEVRRQASIPAFDHCINAIGSFALRELLAVIEDSAVVVTTDSGPFHIAGALGRPTVGMFRSRRPEHSGRYPGVRIVFGKDEECERKCRWDRCRSTPCCQIMDISVARVMEQVEVFCQANRGVVGPIAEKA